VSPDGAEVTAMSWGIYPDGLHELLVRMRADYRPPEIVITESGAAFDDVIAGNVVEHPQRVGYLASHPGLAAAAIGSRSYRTLIQAHCLLAARP
jgi:beta-glucosidase